MGSYPQIIRLAPVALIIAAACVSEFWPQRASAGREDAPAAESAAPRKSDPADGVKAAERFAGQEARAVEFAKLHHSELADLLGQLKGNSRREYRQAIQDLSATSERLARVREKSVERYEHSLAAWKIDSRIRLLAARMAMSEDPALDKELEQLVVASVDVRLAQLRFEQQKAAERAARLNDNITRIEADRESAVRRELDRVKKNLRSGKRAESKASKPKRAGQAEEAQPATTDEAPQETQTPEPRQNNPQPSDPPETNESR